MKIFSIALLVALLASTISAFAQTSTVPNVPPNCNGLNQALQWSTSAGWSCATISGGGGGGTLNGYLDVTAAPYNADPTGTTDSTAAFQAAWNDAKARGDILWLPPSQSGGCYLVGALNFTMTNRARVASAPGACIWPNTTGVLFDLTGSNGISFDHLAIKGHGVTPKVLFLWMIANGNPFAERLKINDVDVDASFSIAALYAYGGQAFSVENSKWVNRYAGAGNADPSQRTTIVRLDGDNSAGMTSAFATVGSGQLGVIGGRFYGVDLIDAPPGYGGSTQDGNSAFDCVTCGGVVSFENGSIQCTCTADAVLWWYAEGLNFRGTAFKGSDGGASVSWFIQIGGGIAGSISLDTPFFSIPVYGGAPIAIDAPVSGRGGGIAHLNIRSPDIGAQFSDGSEHLVSVSFSCTAPAATPWISQSQIEANYMSIVACGDIDDSTILQDVKAVIQPPGTTKYGTQFNP